MAPNTPSKKTVPSKRKTLLGNKRGIYVKLYRSRFPVGRQKWRYRIKDAGNHRTLGPTEAFTNLDDARADAKQVVGSGVPIFEPDGSQL
jgi:hypothetical protein